MNCEQASLTLIIKNLRIAESRTEILELLHRATELAVNFESFYPLGETLLICATSSFVGQLTKKEYDELFLNIFTVAPPSDVLLLLQKRLLSQELKSFEVENCVRIASAFVKRRLKLIFTSMCDRIYSQTSETVQNSICQALVSLPTAVANVLKGEVPRELRLENFFRTIAVGFVEAFELCHRQLQQNTDCSLKFHSNLIGKLHICGYSKHILPILIPFLNKKCHSDFIWTRIAQRFIVGVSHNAIEGLLTEIILLSPGKINLTKLLGDSITESKIRYVLTKKLLFSRYFDDSKVLLAIFDYLSSSLNGRSVLREVFMDLMQVWSSESSVVQSPYQQHFYISRAIVVVSVRLTKNEIGEIKINVTNLLLRGMQNHLNSSRDEIRRIGMVMGEILTKYFETNDNELKFEYADDEQSLVLKNLAKVVVDCSNDEFESDEAIKNLDLLAAEDLISSDIDDENSNSVPDKVVYDSDDDLEPYEMTEETKNFVDKSGKIKAPVYLRDCVSILWDSKDVYRFEAAFFTLEKLIKEDSPGLSDLAVEIVRLLLHIEDRYSTENFNEVRLKCIVAVCVKRPVDVSSYLTEEFYAKNYSLQHRIDILDALRMAAKELSHPPEITSVVNEMEIVSNTVSSKKFDDVSPWRELIQKRIDDKTRRFSQKVKTTEKKPVANRFCSVASRFFYPLLARIDRPADATLDLLNRDVIVLVKLLFTLGSLLLYAENCPDSIGMASCLIEIVFNLRRHKEAAVRQGVLYCLTSVIMCVPCRILAAHFNDSLTEVKFWLENECSKESDDQCKELASRTLNLLQTQMHEGLVSMIEIAIDR